MKLTKRIAFVSALAAAMVGPSSLAAQVFNSGLPGPGSSCVGYCGVVSDDGDVLLSGLAGSSHYGWVSTLGGVQSNTNGVGFNVGGETNGSRFSYSFTASSLTTMSFRFQYVTTEGTSQFPDYAYARISGTQNDVLFTARTVPTGPTVPGAGLPAGAATLGSPTSSIIPGAPDWSPIMATGVECYLGPAQGCGRTGWLSASYGIAAGTYTLEFGVTNYADEFYDSGLAFDFDLANDVPNAPPVEAQESVVPEPATVSLMLAGLAGLAVAARRRKRAV